MFTIYNVFSHFPGKARYALFWPKILIPPPLIRDFSAGKSVPPRPGAPHLATQIDSFWVSDFPCLTHVAHPACALLIPCCPVCRCSFSCVCTLLSDSRSPNHHACRQYCDAQKLGVSYTPNASLHYHNQTSAGTQTYPTPLTPQSLSALLPKPHKYPSKHLSRSLSNISFIF